MEFIADSGGCIIRLVKFGRNNIRYFQRKAIQETPVGSLGGQTGFDVKEYP